MGLGPLGMQGDSLGLDSGVWSLCNWLFLFSEVQQEPELLQGDSP